MDKLEESSKISLDLLASSFYLYKVEEDIVGLGKNIASFFLI